MFSSRRSCSSRVNASQSGQNSALMECNASRRLLERWVVHADDMDDLVLEACLAPVDRRGLVG